MVLKNLQKGFTLVEMMVVLGIMGVISSVLLFNYSDFSSLVKTRNLAQEIALAIRKTQSYATGSHLINDSGGSTVRDYGIIFSKNVTASAYTPGSQSFMIFAALPDPAQGETVGRRYNASGGVCNQSTVSLSQECLEYYNIDKTSYISDVEQVNSSGVAATTASGAGNIVFHRPVSDADMCVTSGLYCVTGSDASGTQISVTSYNKKYSYIISVWNTGQINVQNCKELGASRCP